MEYLVVSDVKFQVLINDETAVNKCRNLVVLINKKRTW